MTSAYSQALELFNADLMRIKVEELREKTRLSVSTMKG